MIGLPSGDGGEALGKMIKSNFVKIVQDKMVVQDVFEFSKHVSFIRKKLEADKERAVSSEQ
jgi:hypothetical protein